uniref:Translation initiation factor eIF2B subunit beta n=1 Tax=Romanomermis culicivorax TaxID=13658 RepID=A0A915KGG3_ROMCU
IPRKNNNSYDVAHTTVSYLRKVVAQQKWSNSDDLISLLQAENRALLKLLPNDFVVGNMVKRVLKLIRDETSNAPKDDSHVDSHDSLQKLWEAGQKKTAPVSNKQLKRTVIETIGEFLTELETCRDNIFDQATDHIVNGDTVMTVGYSTTIEAFLKAAAKKHKFALYVVECAPFFKVDVNGQNLLAAFKNVPNVGATLINDTSIFASMAQVNKVILGAKAIFADGGLQAISGSHTLCLAARHFCVPVIVCTAFYKLTPLFTSEQDQETFNVIESPQSLVPISDGSLAGKLEVYNPVFDYVSPDLITLFVTNVSSNVPSYIYRLQSELYHPDDTDI